MTAAVTAPAVRVPGQAGPPAAERTTHRPNTTTSWELVVRAQTGDRQAFADIYAAYRPVVFRFVYRRCADLHLAEDLTSNVFVRALRNIGSVTWQGRDIGAWLITIARNLVVDHFKASRTRLEHPVDDLFAVDQTDRSPEGDPATTVVDHLTNLTLITAVQQLNPEQHEVIRLRFLLGLSVAETAHELGKNEGAVKALQYRAVRSLARLLPPGLDTTR